jgi:hypothetical protein
MPAVSLTWSLELADRHSPSSQKMTIVRTSGLATSPLWSPRGSLPKAADPPNRSVSVRSEFIAMKCLEANAEH